MVLPNSRFLLESGTTSIFGRGHGWGKIPSFWNVSCDVRYVRWLILPTKTINFLCKRLLSLLSCFKSDQTKNLNPWPVVKEITPSLRGPQFQDVHKCFFDMFWWFEPKHFNSIKGKYGSFQQLVIRDPYKLIIIGIQHNMTHRIHVWYIYLHLP